MNWRKLFGLERSDLVVPGDPFPLLTLKVRPDSQADQIARSLRDFPEDWAWRIKGYELEHVPSGFIMWVGNADYGLAEVVDGSGRKEKFTSDEQRIIWPAVEVWLSRFKTRFTLAPAKPRVRFIGRHWYCRSDEHPWLGVGETPTESYRSWIRAVSVQARNQIRPNECLHVWSAEA